LKKPELRHIGSIQNPHSDLYVTVQLWADSKPLTVPVQTSYKPFKTSRTWNEWLSIPIAVRDLPASSQLAITVWDLSPLPKDGSYRHTVPFGGTTVPLFDKESTLQKGKQKCKIYRHVAADGLSSTKTPWTPPPQRRNDKLKDYGISPEEEELDRLEKLLKKHDMGDIPRIDWQDRLVFRAIEHQRRLAEEAAKKRSLKLRSQVDIGETNGTVNGDHKAKPSEDESIELGDGENFTLYIDFPRFDFPIVFADYEYPAPSISTQTQHTPSASRVTLKPPPEVTLGPGIEAHADIDSEMNSRIIRIYDPEVGQRDNPAENKHRRLVRSHRTGIMDRDLKPNPKIRDELNVIMLYGPTQELNPEEKDVVWRFRHHLTRDKRALTKFVKSVNWVDPSEAREAVQILPKWSEISVDDALELLGPTFDNAAVRAYAVDRLKKADDEELLLYLLQLVQALKFEKISPDASGETSQDSSLAEFLISRATSNFILGNFFHWYLMVECDDKSPDQSKAHRKLFARVEYDFMTHLDATSEGVEQRRVLLRQGELITVLSKISKDVRFARENRTHKIDRLKKYVTDAKNELLVIDPPLPLPLDPEVLITGCFPEDSNVFKSSLSPLHIIFKTSTGKKYPVIFKTGDDLRQDQLVIQIITLMDRLLQKENLDLKLSPYRILATSSTAGAVQFIPSTSLSAASAKYKGSILAYLRANNPDDSEPLGVRKETMDTYIKSCAGYCVITYLLGVGDRHLENLLLAPDGHFFHIDFGFILGRDPKPFAPMMKLCKEMVEGMGGANSPHYALFKQYCYTAYTTLRKSANLILNLFSLMVDANVPDIRMEPDKAVLKVKERFHLEMSEEEAIRHFEQLINDSVNAIFGVVIDRLHDFVQGWRA
jgi:phosphatidylinositol 3-kinase